MPIRWAKLVLSFLFVLSSEANAQVPHLVKDLNRSSAGSIPLQKIEMGGHLYFTAFHTRYGRELWRSDGTTRGTVLVKDLVPGKSDGKIHGAVSVDEQSLFFFHSEGDRHTWSLWLSDGTSSGTNKVAEFSSTGYPFGVPVRGGIYFRTGSPSDGYELWASDGTPDGTIRLVDGMKSLDTLMPLGERVLFVADDEIHGRELWITDGTVDGTVLHQDVRPGPEGSRLFFSIRVEHNGDLYFTAHDEVHGTELWIYDRETARAAMVKDLVPGRVGSVPRGLTALDGKIYFLTHRSPYLWVTDGTEAGTYVVAEVPGVVYGLRSLTAAEDRLFFLAKGNELWTSDGTRDGTRLVASGQGGVDGWRPDDLVGAGGRVFFTANDDVHGVELWTSDGTRSGTRMARDIRAGPASPFYYGKWGYHSFSFEFDGRVVFIADDGKHGYELWISDGTKTGTYVLKDIKTGPNDIEVGGFLEIDQRLFFTADDGVHGTELWSTDGTRRGTALVRDIDSKGTLSSFPSQLVGQEGVLYFTADDCTFECQDRLFYAHDYSHSAWQRNRELWRSDGTAAGTFRVLDLNLEGESRPEQLVATASGLFFFADDGVHGRELWISDGTRGGTRLVKDLRPGPEGGGSDLVVAGERLFFGYWGRLYVSDGTEAGTRPVGGYNSGGGLHTFGDRVLFLDQDLTHGEEVWISDATEAGTHLLKDIFPGTYSGFPTLIGESGGAFFFSVRDEEHGRELWITDGTTGGTRLVKDIAEGEADSVGFRSNPALGEVGSQLLFVANDGVHGKELWATDGTESGTYMVKDIASGPGDSVFDFYGGAVLGGRLYFPADDGVHGFELWSSDGTEEGTYLVTDIASGVEPSRPRSFHEHDGRIYFAAYEDVHGGELWSTDGTPEGTTLVADLESGRGSSWPREFESVGTHLFFVASSRRSGNELWVLRAGAATAGLPKLLALPDLDGLGGEELATLGSSLSVRDAASGVAISNMSIAPSRRWEAIDFEFDPGSNGQGLVEIATLARFRKQARISMRDALTGLESSLIELPSAYQPIDLEIIPGDGEPSRAAVLNRGGLGGPASVVVMSLEAPTTGPLEFALPGDLEVLDVELSDLPGSERAKGRWGLVILGRSRTTGTAHVVTLDAVTGETLGYSNVGRGLVPIDLEIAHRTASEDGHAIVLARRQGNGKVRVVTLNPFDGSVVRKLRMRKKRVPLDLEVKLSQRGSGGANVSILWTDESGSTTVVSTWNAFTGKKLKPLFFDGVRHHADFSLVRLPGDKAAAAVLGEAECVGHELAIALRDTANGELLACYAVE